MNAIDPSRATLLVMDYQNGIVQMFEQADVLLDRAASAIATMRRSGGQVGYARFGLEPEEVGSVPASSPLGELLRSAPGLFDARAEATAVHDAIAPAAGEAVLRKPRTGAFSGTDLARRLREDEIETLIVCGLATSGCVLSTVRDAADRDLRVIVLADACADPDPEVHTFLVERIFPLQAEVASVSELPTLLGSAGGENR